MSQEAPIYDLMLLLSTSAEDGQRAKILADVEKAIASGGGTIVRNDDWGVRSMAYRIKHQADAEYHLLQLSAPTALLESLNQRLHITDGVLRFRFSRVLPGTPPAPESAPPVVAAAAPASGPPPSAPAEVAPEPAAVAAVPEESGE